MPNRSRLLDWHESFILHRRPWRESSLWLEVFARDAGKVVLLAKGVRRARNSSSRLQPFQFLLLRWRRRGDLGTVIGVEDLSPPLPLPGRAIYCAFYLNELLSRMLARDDPHPVLYEEYCQALTALAGGGEMEPCLRRFELRLLEETGYAPILDHEVEYGAAILADRRYHYEPERGPVVDGSGWLHGRTLLALAAGKLESAEQRHEAKLLLRLLITHHLHGQPLKSQLLFHQDQRKHEL